MPLINLEMFFARGLGDIVTLRIILSSVGPVFETSVDRWDESLFDS